MCGRTRSTKPDTSAVRYRSQSAISGHVCKTSTAAHGWSPTAADRTAGTPTRRCGNSSTPAARPRGWGTASPNGRRPVCRLSAGPESGFFGQEWCQQRQRIDGRRRVRGGVGIDKPLEHQPVAERDGHRGASGDPALSRSASRCGWSRSLTLVVVMVHVQAFAASDTTEVAVEETESCSVADRTEAFPGMGGHPATPTSRTRKHRWETSDTPWVTATSSCSTHHLGGPRPGRAPLLRDRPRRPWTARGPGSRRPGAGHGYHRLRDLDVRGARYGDARGVHVGLVRVHGGMIQNRVGGGAWCYHHLPARSDMGTDVTYEHGEPGHPRDHLHDHADKHEHQHEHGGGPVSYTH